MTKELRHRLLIRHGRFRRWVCRQVTMSMVCWGLDVLALVVAQAGFRRRRGHAMPNLLSSVVTRCLVAELDEADRAAHTPGAAEQPLAGVPAAVVAVVPAATTVAAVAP